MTAPATPNGGYRNATMHGPMVPAAAIAALIVPVIEQDGGSGSLAPRSGVPARRIYGIVSGEQKRVAFGVADRLLTLGLGDPSLWYSVPELAAVIEEDAA